MLNWLLISKKSYHNLLYYEQLFFTAIDVEIAELMAVL